MLRKIILNSIIILFLFSSFSFCSETISCFNLRCKRYQDFVINLNLIHFRHSDIENNNFKFPLNTQIGLGSGRVNIGFGFGTAGTPEGPIDDILQPYGKGLRFQVFKPWNLISDKKFMDYSKVYFGVEHTITFMFVGFDIGYMIPHDFVYKNSYFSFGIGIGY